MDPAYGKRTGCPQEATLPISQQIGSGGNGHASVMCHGAHESTHMYPAYGKRTGCPQEATLPISQQIGSGGNGHASVMCHGAHESTHMDPAYGKRTGSPKEQLCQYHNRLVQVAMDMRV